MKALMAMAALIVPAQAQGIDMLPFYENAPRKVERAPVVKVSASKPKRKAKPRRRVYASRPAAPVVPVNTDAVTRCLAPVRVVGSQDVRESAAEESAKKAWMERVRFESGEMFQDIGNAQSYAKRCVRSSIGEALGQYFHRCEVEALPCRPGMTEGVK